MVGPKSNEQTMEIEIMSKKSTNIENYEFWKRTYWADCDAYDKKFGYDATSEDSEKFESYKKMMHFLGLTLMGA